MDLSPYKNILRCIEYSESLDDNLILKCNLDIPNLRKYDTIIFMKNNENKVDSIQILNESKNDKYNFFILPTKDKELIDSSINISFG